MTTDARRAKQTWIQALPVDEKTSMLEELQGQVRIAARASACTSAVLGAPRALRRKLREIRRLEQLQLQGATLDCRQRALLRRRPLLQESLCRAQRPAQGVSVDNPPAVARRGGWDSFEQDLLVFKRNVMAELSGIIDHHLQVTTNRPPRSRLKGPGVFLAEKLEKEQAEHVRQFDARVLRPTEDLAADLLQRATACNSEVCALFAKGLTGFAFKFDACVVLFLAKTV